MKNFSSAFSVNQSPLDTSSSFPLDDRFDRFLSKRRFRASNSSSVSSLAVSSSSSSSVAAFVTMLCRRCCCCWDCFWKKRLLFDSRTRRLNIRRLNHRRLASFSTSSFLLSLSFALSFSLIHLINQDIYIYVLVYEARATKKKK